MSKEKIIHTWNYRVLAFSFEETYFEVRTVYYENGKPTSFGDPGHPIGGTSVKSTKITAKNMAKALEKPVLWGNIAGEKNLFPNKYKKLKTKKKMYKILRPTLWFCKNDVVQKDRFDSYFTQEGLTQLIKYGFVEEI